MYTLIAVHRTGTHSSWQLLTTARGIFVLDLHTDHSDSLFVRDDVPGRLPGLAPSTESHALHSTAALPLSLAACIWPEYGNVPQKEEYTQVDSLSILHK